MSVVEIFGSGTVEELLGDFLIFRKLQPLDRRLPGLEDLRPRLGISSKVVPRKLTYQYGLVVANIIMAAKKVQGDGQEVDQLIYIGDTKGSDVTAFMNICEAANWKGAAFIGDESTNPGPLKIDRIQNGILVYAQQWRELYSFEEVCAQNNLLLNEQTAVVLDLDKTTLGARGRNDQVITKARIAAITHTVEKALGDLYDEEQYKDLYRVINQDRYHFFTEDNQDYVAYICIMVGGGLIKLDDLLVKLKHQDGYGFSDFVAEINRKRDQMTSSLDEIHVGFSTYYRQGDPTPLKQFRYQEYQETIKRMGNLDQKHPVNKILLEEITITAEVYHLASKWKDRELLIFGLSDKPDEASIPTQQQVAAGFLPIHRQETLILGTRQ